MKNYMNKILSRIEKEDRHDEVVDNMATLTFVVVGCDIYSHYKVNLPEEVGEDEIEALRNGEPVRQRYDENGDVSSYYILVE